MILHSMHISYSENPLQQLKSVDVADNTYGSEIRIENIVNSDSEQLLKSFGGRTESIINNFTRAEYFKHYAKICVHKLLLQKTNQHDGAGDGI